MTCYVAQNIYISSMRSYSQTSMILRKMWGFRKQRAFPSERASDAEFGCFCVSLNKRLVELTVILDAVAVMRLHCNGLLSLWPWLTHEIWNNFVAKLRVCCSHKTYSLGMMCYFLKLTQYTVKLQRGFAQQNINRILSRVTHICIRKLWTHLVQVMARLLFATKPLYFIVNCTIIKIKYIHSHTGK